MRLLPVELLDEIASHLDRDSLLQFVRVSSEFWEIGVPRIYRRMRVDERQFQCSLALAGGVQTGGGEDGCNAPSAHRDERASSNAKLTHNRIRRAFEFVEYLELLAPLHAPTIGMLQNAAAVRPEVPLFPGVRYLSLDSGVYDKDLDTASKLVKDGVLVFDQVDVCLIDQPFIALQLACFPAREHRVVNHVDMGRPTLCFLADDSLAPTCTSLRIFSAHFYHIIQDMLEEPDLVTSLENALVASGHRPGAVHIGLQVRAVLSPEDLEEWEEQIKAMFLALEKEGWTPGPDRRVQISFADSPKVRPPCPVCGTSASNSLGADEKERPGRRFLGE